MQLLSLVFGSFFDKTLDFRVRLFNVLAMGGTVLSLAMVLIGILTDAPLWNIVVNFISSGVSYALLYYSWRMVDTSCVISSPLSPFLC